jgi:hypothetical protein
MDHPFIVRLHYAFQTSKKLFLLVDFMSGVFQFYIIGIIILFIKKI